MGPRPSLAAFAALTIIIALLSLSATPATAEITTRIKLDRHTAAARQDAPSFFARAWRWVRALSAGAPEVMLRRSSSSPPVGDASKEGVIPLLNYLDAQVRE